MNITVLIKHVVDSTEVRFDKNTGELSLRGLPEKISDYDKNAIEEAIRLKSKFGGTVTAISFGKKDAIKSLKEAVAMGADNGILISNPQFEQIYDPFYIAKVLGKGIEKVDNCDLVFCGDMSEDITNKIVGPMLATNIGFNYVPNVSKISIEGNSKFIALCEIDGYEIEVEASFPAVISVSRKLNEPRLATKIQIMKVQSKKISTMTLEDIGMTENIADESACLFESFTPITKERKHVIFDGDAANTVKELINTLKQEKVL